jgi:phage gp46-like protein
MSDLRIVFNGLEMHGDMAIVPPGMAEDDGLETAVIISLFTDARAPDDAVLPDGSQDRRGWWGDAYGDDPTDSTGSLIWLLTRSKQLQSVVTEVRDFSKAALAWLVTDGVARAVEVEAEITAFEVLGWSVAIYRLNQPVARYRFEAFWQGVAAGAI